MINVTALVLFVGLWVLQRFWKACNFC